MRTAPLLVVGLGNPGLRYQLTYHSVGVLAADHIAATSGVTHWRTPARGSTFSYQRIDDVVLVKSLTFMNDSGAAVRAALRFFRGKPESLVIMHDESDLPLGRFKISTGRGAAGHRGVLSVIRAIGTASFTRVRIGVRSAPGRAGSFVLRRIPPAARETLYGVFEDLRKKLMEKYSP